MFKKQKMPVILAINKIDMINDKEELFKRIVYLTSFYDFTAVVPVSATEGDHVDELIDELDKLAFESPHFFPDDTLNGVSREIAEKYTDSELKECLRLKL